jgi:hypothetical protein
MYSSTPSTDGNPIAGKVARYYDAGDFLILGRNERRFPICTLISSEKIKIGMATYLAGQTYVLDQLSRFEVIADSYGKYISEERRRKYQGRYIGRVCQDGNGGTHDVAIVTHWDGRFAIGHTLHGTPWQSAKPVRLADNAYEYTIKEIEGR